MTLAPALNSTGANASAMVRRSAAVSVDSNSTPARKSEYLSRFLVVVPIITRLKL